jgi:hypothetical protein
LALAIGQADQTPGLAQQLQQLCKGPGNRTAEKTRIVKALAEHGTDCPAAVDPLFGCLDDSRGTGLVDPSLVCRALVMVSASDVAVRDRLMSLAENPKEQNRIRMAILGELWHWKDNHELLRRVVAILQHDELLEARAAAVAYLGQLSFDGAPALPALKGCLADKREAASVQAACREAIKSIEWGLKWKPPEPKTPEEKAKPERRTSEYHSRVPDKQTYQTLAAAGCRDDL